MDFFKKEGLGTDVWQFENRRPPLRPQYCRSQNISPPPRPRYCRSQNIRQPPPVFRLLSSETSDSTWELASDLGSSSSPPPPSPCAVTLSPLAPRAMLLFKYEAFITVVGVAVVLAVTVADMWLYRPIQVTIVAVLE
jgi:hypothetical protein